MRISDWSSDVCSSDLVAARRALGRMGEMLFQRRKHRPEATVHLLQHHHIGPRIDDRLRRAGGVRVACPDIVRQQMNLRRVCRRGGNIAQPFGRSEEHTSELQSLMRISYAVFCLKKKKTPPRKSYVTRTK